MTPLRAQLRQFWQRLSRPDLVAGVIVVLGVALYLLGASGRVINFVKFAAILCAGYMLIRFIGWWRSRLLWSLRNRLIVAYLLIALVPVVLIFLLAIQTGKLLYTQLGGYLLYEDMQRRIEMVSSGADQISSALSSRPEGISPETAERIVAAQEHEVYDERLPGLTIEFT